MLELREINEQAVDEIFTLAPFGHGNPPPLFAALGCGSGRAAHRHEGEAPEDHGAPERADAGAEGVELRRARPNWRPARAWTWRSIWRRTPTRLRAAIPPGPPCCAISGRNGERSRRVADNGRNMTPETLEAIALPAVPLTVEGASVLHQMMRFRWAAWRALSAEQRGEILEAVATLGAMESPRWPPERRLFAAGPQGRPAVGAFPAQLRGTEPGGTRARAPAARRLPGALSVVSLDHRAGAVRIHCQGLYRVWRRVAWSRTRRNGSAEIEAVLERQRQAMAPRLWPEIPPQSTSASTPWTGAAANPSTGTPSPWRTRQRMMHEHGMVGRRYAGEVRQIITGSIGFDDWEWGVDLFADDPLVFKKLIYEMRFDEVSAVYALFGIVLRGPARAGRGTGEFGGIGATAWPPI